VKEALDSPDRMASIRVKARETMTFQDQTFYVASKEDLISSTRASGGDIDLEDVRLLELPDKKQEQYRK